MHDYLIVGSGLFGATFAQQVTEAGKSALVIDKNKHVAGNCHTERIEGIMVHTKGPHIFHTNSQRIWNYLNRFTQFNHYRHKARVRHGNKIYSFPINLMTLYQVWGVTTPGEAEEKLQKVRVPIEVPANLEEWCLSQVGEELYELFVKGYTAKQWMCDPKELPASIIKRLPIRLTYDDGYFDDVYQGIPVCGYTQMVENMLVGIPVELGVDFFEIEDWRKLAKKLIYTGPIDRLFGYRHGRLGYRTLDFRHEVVNGDFQGIAQVNYADKNVPWTRITEHKHFEFLKSDKSVVTWETPVAWQPHSEPYYPLSDAENQGSFQKYMSEAKLLGDVVIGGRLGSYQYLDMHQAVGAALKEAEKELSNG